MVTGNVANEDMEVSERNNSQSTFVFYKFSLRTVGPPLPIFKGECCLLLLLASHWVETYCLHADWIFALGGVNPPSSSKGLLHSFLRFWLARQESKSLCPNGRPLRVKQFIYISVWFLLCSGSLFYTTLKPSLQSDTVWLWCLQETYCKCVLLRFWMEIHESIQQW